MASLMTFGATIPFGSCGGSRSQDGPRDQLRRDQTKTNQPQPGARTFKPPYRADRISVRAPSLGRARAVSAATAPGGDLHSGDVRMTTATPRTAAVLEPETQKFVGSLAAAGGPPLYSLTPDAARDVLAGAQAIPVTKLPASIQDTTFPVGPTGSVRIRIVRPEGAKGALPVVMHFHGGGWILGDKETHDRMTREIAVGADAAVVFVDYDRSPEAEYPVAIEQAFAATQYVAGHGKELGLDPTRLAVLGDS